MLILAIWLSDRFWPAGWPLARYDGLFLIALATQLAFLLLKLETGRELAVIGAFAALGLGMELFKTHLGMWAYPEPGRLALGGVPLFVGFMYAAVGLCVARMIRLFAMDFTPFPPRLGNGLLCLLIYLNFFTMHFGPDLRLGLFALTALAYGRVWIGFEAFGARRRMPMLLSLICAALGVWLVENLGTLTGTWLYAGQARGETVSLATLGSWYLFLCVALAVVLLVAPGATTREQR